MPKPLQTMQTLLATLRDMVYPGKCRLCHRFTVNQPPNLNALNWGDRTFTAHELLNIPAPNICAHCLGQLQILPQAVCSRCGCVPVNGVCVNCLEHPPLYVDSCIALLFYTAETGNIIKRFKYGGDLYLGRFLSLCLLAGLAINPQNAITYHMAAPVPLHPKKQKARKFNQNQRLMQYWPKLGCNKIAGLQNAKLNAPLLQRGKATRSQAGLNAAERMLNVADAFNVRENNDLTGLNILLVDDIVTTGATAENCAKALKLNGAARVDVMCIARTMPHLNPGHLMEI